MRRSFTGQDRLYVAGHRGNREKCPENTLKAFKEAIADGVDMIETDVRLTKDRALVLIHDETVDRTTDKTGLVKSYSFDAIRKINAGTDAEFQNIPTLQELLELLQGTKITLNLEFKEYCSDANKSDCEYCINEALRLIEEYNMKERTLCNSFDAYVLEYIEAHYPGEYSLHGFYPYSNMHNVNRKPDEYLHCACVFDIGDKELFDYLVSKGIEPWVGAGVKTREQLELSIANGARLVTTDNPESTLALLSEISA